MGLIQTPADLLTIGRAIRTEFNDTLRTTPVWRDQVATTVPSTARSNTYAWLESVAPVREWLGPRIYNDLVAHKYELENKLWEKTISVKRDDVEDSNLGMVSTTTRMTAESFAKHPDVLLASLLNTGHSTLCYDGQNFFDTDHPVAGGVVSNYESTGFALTLANAMTARARMSSITNEEGQIIATDPALLVVPPLLESAALKISRSALALETSGTSFAAVDNVGRGLFNVLRMPELAAAPTTWYLLDVSRILKPLIFQSRRAVELESFTSGRDQVVFEQNKYVWGGSARYNVGVSLWQLAFKGVA
jgi:phage major head subunit gpT-like protein